jgi:uncharacterized protein (DUF111 family)
MDQANMPEGNLHAHWDCSNGVSGSAILAACLGAAKDPKQTQEWIEDLQSLLSQVVRQNTGVTVGIKILRVLDDGSLTIEYHSNLAQFSNEWTFAWSALVDILDEDDFSPWVLENSRAVILQLIEAETKAQESTSTPMTGIQFLDFFVEIVGSLWCLDRLRVRTASCSPLPLATNLNTNRNNEQTQKGQKRPRYMEQLLCGMPVSLESRSQSPVMTDTSVALLRVLTGVASSSHSIATVVTPQPPPLTLRATSRGTNLLPVPHCVRLFIGETLPTTTTKDMQRDAHTVKNNESNSLWKVHRMMLLETNIDDMSGEHLAFCVDQLLLSGAADAWVTSIVMKKGRAAHTLHCLCREDQTDALLPVVFTHSTTLGVRTRSIDRVALERKIFTVQTEWIDTLRRGLVDVKVGYLGAEKVVSVKAEFDHCKQIALEVGIPIQSVADQAVRKARDMQRDVTFK